MITPFEKFMGDGAYYSDPFHWHRSQQIEEAIDASQRVQSRDVVVEVGRVEELVLSAIQLTRRDDLLPLFDVFQDTQHSASKTTFSTESANICQSGKPSEWLLVYQ